MWISRKYGGTTTKNYQSYSDNTLAERAVYNIICAGGDLPVGLGTSRNQCSPLPVQATNVEGGSDFNILRACPTSSHTESDRLFTVGYFGCLASTEAAKPVLLICVKFGDFCQLRSVLFRWHTELGFPFKD